ncbi:glycosyltransferase family 4 protein [Citrifermentans bremense]|uniref:glycosyltransferase family 4 protein n=1 Tax=Citrifermentans bremense TaxID=60035 RepID=UPI0003FE3BE5|nr:glycosyltransferase family 4 protein [Citrifermentans bremense]
MSRARVLIIVPERLIYGGAARFLERLLVIHQRHRFESALLTPEHLIDDALRLLAGRYRVPVFSAVNRTRPETPPYLTPFYDLEFVWPTLRTWRPDLVLVSTSDPGRMSVALYLPVPALYVLHSVPEHSFRLLPRLYLRVGAMFRNRVATVSRAAAQAIAATMGFPLEKIALLHNSSAVVGGGCASADPLVVTAGHVVPYKNPLLWLDAAVQVVRQHEGATFVWLGDGELLEALRRRVAALRLQDRILLPGFVPDISPWLARAQLYFQPSLRESHGIAVLEAMSSALPCVVADTGGLPESVVGGETGFVCAADDTAGFAARILQLLSDPALREEMGQRGRERVQQHFSQARQEEKLLSLYRSLTGKPVPPEGIKHD